VIHRQRKLAQATLFTAELSTHTHEIINRQSMQSVFFSAVFNSQKTTRVAVGAYRRCIVTRSTDNYTRLYRGQSYSSSNTRNTSPRALHFFDIGLRSCMLQASKCSTSIQPLRYIRTPHIFGTISHILFAANAM
jgi:hypothetical protein